MKDFPLDKYRYITYGRTVVAISTYEGKEVKGKAQCDPSDKYSEEQGKRLAAARCNAKIAKKRLRRAAEKYEKIRLEYLDTMVKFDDVCDYLKNSDEQVRIANKNVENILNEL